MSKLSLLALALAVLVALFGRADSHDLSPQCNGGVNGFERQWSYVGNSVGSTNKLIYVGDKHARMQACCTACIKMSSCKIWEWQGLGDGKYVCKFFGAAAKKTPYRGPKGVGQMSGVVRK